MRTLEVPEKINKIKVRCVNGRARRIWLDGRELPFTSGIEIDWAPHSSGFVTVRLVTECIEVEDVDADALDNEP